MPITEGTMEDGDKEKIQKNFIFLKAQIDQKYLLDLLFEKGVLDIHKDFEFIDKGCTIEAKNEIFLTLLLQAGPFAYEHFLEALKKENYHHVVERLEGKEMESCTSEKEKKEEKLLVAIKTLTETQGIYLIDNIENAASFLAERITKLQKVRITLLLNKSKSRYILLCLCINTGWIEVSKLDDNSYENVAKAIYIDVYCRYGCYQIIAAWEERVIRKLTFKLRKTHALDVDITPPTENNPNFDEKMMGRLRFCMDKKTEVWISDIASVLLEYRFNTSVGFDKSPFENLFSQKPPSSTINRTARNKESCEKNSERSRKRKQGREVSEPKTSTHKLICECGSEQNIKKNEECNIKK